MDEMAMLRDLGRELETEPPATLGRQRRRLLAAPSRPRLRFRVRGWPAVAVAATVTAVALLLPAFLVSRQVTSPGVGGEDPGVPEGPINVLIIGTDGEMGKPAYRFGARSDTMILAHLSADRKRTTILNIPRDTMVMIHGCGSAPARLNMINQAYDIGGLGCAVKTVESVTGLRVDHGMEFDFSGFKSMVDALGGVEVHLPRPVDDPKAKLTLPAGRHVVNGETALAYARLRYYGDGSDLQRIKRQQWLMSAMVKKARESLTDPARLYAFLREVMDSVKTTDGFDLETLATLARSLERTGSVTYLTAPWRPYPTDRNRLILKRPEADEVFDAIRRDDTASLCSGGVRAFCE
ncbi:LCP family protein [Sphaerimonospora mesophila]|uniref:LCP family protein n=1 Tax=Sphaerimonospora mesophila TaxID=37483 RepID=UPI0006E17CAD